MSDELIFLSETTKALMVELDEAAARVAAGDKVNRKYLVKLAERLRAQIPIAAGETMAEYLSRVSDHLEGGLANTALVKQAEAGLLSPSEELKALKYQRDLLDEKIEHLEWLREYPEIQAMFEERGE